MKCTNLVISAGPWSDRVFKLLFPFAKVKIPLNVSGASGNHLLIRTPHWKPSDDDFGCDQVYLDNVIVGGARLDVSTLLGGTMYVGGYGADPEELPALATQVQPQPNAVKAMKELVAGFLNLGEGESVEVLKEGRAYRPKVAVGRPIIAKLPPKLLFGENAAKVGDEDNHSASAHIDVYGGVFVNTGHNRDGVTLGPGSGKVMAELIRGVKTSVDISGLGLPA
jgi:glycine/D-amino acid oxidase-like deaminating enzyme